MCSKVEAQREQNLPLLAEGKQLDHLGCQRGREEERVFRCLLRREQGSRERKVKEKTVTR